MDFHKTLLLMSISVAVVTAEPKCPKSASVAWVPDDSDCSAFYLCYNGQHFKYVCPDQLGWDPTSRSCLHKDSLPDRCNSSPPRIPCSSGKRHREEHQGNCAKYYECSDTRVVGVKEATLMECPYPLLFNIGKERCEFPESVKCDGRTEPKDPCDYDANKCPSGNCEPCYLIHASCKGLPDGPNPWVGKEWTPEYAVCKEERVVYTGMCGKDERGVQKKFDPDKRECIKQIIIGVQ